MTPLSHANIWLSISSKRDDWQVKSQLRKHFNNELHDQHNLCADMRMDWFRQGDPPQLAFPKYGFNLGLLKNSESPSKRDLWINDTQIKETFSRKQLQNY